MASTLVKTRVGRPRSSFSIDTEGQATEGRSSDFDRSGSSLPATTSCHMILSTLLKLFQLACSRVSWKHERDGITADSPFGVNLDRPSIVDLPFSERAGQCCFLCLQGEEQQVAVAVPCFRPTMAPLFKSRRFRPRKDKDANPSDVESILEHAFVHKTNSDIDLKQEACESDAAIFERLKRTCFEHRGTWKAWLPFYGVVSVKEVNFQFVGIVDSKGKFPIRTTLNLDEIQPRIDKIISHEARQSIRRCTEAGWHSDDCKDVMGKQEKSRPHCIVTLISLARSQRRRLQMPDLFTLCAQRPSEANGLKMLEGLPTQSCIYETNVLDRVVMPVRNQEYKRCDELHGLHFTLGWQTDRIYRELPRNVSWVYLSVIVIWLCVIAWAEPRGDWSTALAFGQLMAACIALLVFYTQ